MRAVLILKLNYTSVQIGLTVLWIDLNTFSIMFGNIMALQPIFGLTLLKFVWTENISDTNTFTIIYYINAHILWGRPYFVRTFRLQIL